MVAGLNRRVTAFMDVQGAENMVKVWEKKHEEDIQALCYYHPNVLVTASYDGDILVWSTETNQTACRLNFTENTKPMMGHDRPTRTESQRTLIAKRFNLAITRAVNPDGQCDKSKLRFMDLMRATIAAAGKEEESEGNDRSPSTSRRSSRILPAINKPKLQKQVPTGELTPITSTSYDTLPQVTISRQTSRTEMSISKSSKRSMQRCHDCFGYKKPTEASELSLIAKGDTLWCRCDQESSTDVTSVAKPVKSSLQPNEDSKVANFLKPSNAAIPAVASKSSHTDFMKPKINSFKKTDVNKSKTENQQLESDDIEDPHIRKHEMSKLWARVIAKVIRRNSTRIDDSMSCNTDECADCSALTEDECDLSATSSTVKNPLSHKLPTVKRILAKLLGPQQMISSTCIECVVSLQERKVDKKTAIIMAAGLDGWIRAWSIHYKGGLLGQFRGSHRPQDAVTCMAIDSKNIYLFTGDAYGYVKVWFIGDYCTKAPYTSTLSEDEKAAFKEERMKKFHYYAMQKFFKRFEKEEHKLAMETINPTPLASDPLKTVKRPILLSSYRAHTKSVTCIMYAESYQLVVTGAEDNNVRVWTLGGRYVGQLGIDSWPKLEEGNFDWTDEHFEFKIPPDVRRVASPRTLRVFHGGISKRWKLVKTGMMLLTGPWFKLGMAPPASSVPIKDFSSRNTSYASPSASPTVVARRPRRAYKRISDSLAIPTMPYDVDAGKSKILGKSYQKLGRHKAFPDVKDFYGIETSVQVWPKVTTTDMTEVKSVSDYGPPEVLISRDKRRYKYINQLANNKTNAKRVLVEHVRAGKFYRGSLSEVTTQTRTLGSPSSPTSSRPNSVKEHARRNPFLPSGHGRGTDQRKKQKQKSKSSKHQELETITIDKLALEIAEILGEAEL